ncbi:MAG: FIST C-terminal domain-containing protein [Chitinophagaceae bacterium]|nr:FIST C-terminal domain-containing protein [Chitinophagaceae bacterium]MBP6988890.1 FIST C-terminal domain-containing protein [Ferruginibacter sp.]MBK7087561.1 FIST C-terminal domain-containing protein [Chitinophagaceae bacterium]MBK7346332.1 FIST C-terminal domain-containing protein [Chitinophagaceae bacterium]MBK7735845.1 FIST C-terminal domain-containing protein [Chitinophagaceae bacterium]
MQAKTVKGKYPREIQLALQQHLNENFKPTLAIVFISVKQDRKAICEILQKEEIDVFGATSCGEFINGHQSEGEIVVLLFDMAKEFYSILFEEINDRSISDAVSKLANDALQKFKNPGVIVCSTGMTAKGEYFDGETFVRSLENYFGTDKIFFGGMAGDDWTFSGTYVFNNQQETDLGIVALVVDMDKVSLNGMAITGWKPMGISRTVTKSKGTLLYTIDNKPAIEMYFKYLGQTEKLDDKDFNMFKEISIHYPLIVKRETGETVLRSPMSIDHVENALVMDSEMQEGTEFWFTVPPDFDIAEEIIAQAEQIKSENMGDADALLIFSCAGRPPVLGPLVTVENNGLADVWQTPMAGFFTYGEYGRAKNGRQEFHSGACCWVALKEK